PWPVRPEISSPQVPIPCAETIEKKVLRHTRFETFSEVDSSTPRVLNSNRVKGPRVKGLRNILSEQEAGLAKEHETAERTSPKRAYFEHTRKHEAGECVARGVHATETASIGAT